MKACVTCGSYAINPHLHGRQPGIDLDLCDVCYWRKRATATCAQMSHDFTKVADLAPEHVRDADISHHLTTALFDLAQLTDAQRSVLYDVVRMHQTPEQRRRILAVLAFTEVATLTKLQLWDE